MAYGKLCTLFYDTDKPQAPAEEADYFFQLAKAHPGPVLEPMCGSGRMMVPLLIQGIDLEGFDLSLDMLAACQEKLKEYELTARTELASFDTFQPSQPYSMIFIGLGSICLLTDPEILARGLQRIHSWLNPGGVFAFDFDLTHHQYSFEFEPGSRWVNTPNGDVIKIYWSGSYDHKTQVNHSIGKYELIRSGQVVETEDEVINLRLYTPDQIVDLMENAGFANVKIDGFHGVLVDTTTAETMTCLAYRP